MKSVSGRNHKRTNTNSWNRCRLTWSILFSLMGICKVVRQQISEEVVVLIPPSSTECFMNLAERVGTTTEQQLYRPSTMTRSYSVQYSCWLQLINYHKNTSSRLLELNDCWSDLRNCVLVKYNCVHTDMTAHTAQHCYDGDAAVLWGTTVPLYIHVL